MSNSAEEVNCAYILGVVGDFKIARQQCHIHEGKEEDPIVPTTATPTTAFNADQNQNTVYTTEC